MISRGVRDWCWVEKGSFSRHTYRTIMSFEEYAVTYTVYYLYTEFAIPGNASSALTFGYNVNAMIPSVAIRFCFSGGRRMTHIPIVTLRCSRILQTSIHLSAGESCISLSTKSGIFVLKTRISDCCLCTVLCIAKCNDLSYLA